MEEAWDWDKEFFPPRLVFEHLGQILLGIGPLAIGAKVATNIVDKPKWKYK